MRRAKPSGAEISSSEATDDGSANDEAVSDEPRSGHPDEAQLTAGALRCAPHQIAITDSVFNGSSGAWTAHCRNRHFDCTYESGKTRCKKVRLDEPEEATASAATSSSAASTGGPTGHTVARSVRPPAAPEPSGGAGFELGATLEETAAACSSANQSFVQKGEGYFCSGTVKSIGLPAEAHFRFCDGKVCSIEMLARPAKTTSGPWIKGYASLSKALTDKYGSSNLELRKLPEECRDRLVACLGSGEAEFAHTWIWSKKMNVVLAMDHARGEPAIRLVYTRSTDAGTQAIDPSAL